MLPTFPLTKLEGLQTATAWDSRLPLYAEALGPNSMGSTYMLPGELWTARVVGHAVELTAPDSNKHTAQLPVGARKFSFCFDLNGRLAYAVSMIDSILWTYFDDREQEERTLVIPGTSACCALDAVAPRLEPPTDIVLAYTIERNLYIRYQRERFDIEHFQGTIDTQAVLRTVGIAGSRFMFRFDRNIGDGIIEHPENP